MQNTYSLPCTGLLKCLVSICKGPGSILHNTKTGLRSEDNLKCWTSPSNLLERGVCCLCIQKPARHMRSSRVYYHLPSRNRNTGTINSNYCTRLHNGLWESAFRSPCLCSKYFSYGAISATC